MTALTVIFGFFGLLILFESLFTKEKKKGDTSAEFLNGYDDCNDALKVSGTRYLHDECRECGLNCDYCDGWLKRLNEETEK